MPDKREFRYADHGTGEEFTEQAQNSKLTNSTQRNKAMKRFVLGAMFALTAVAMALTASAATAAENVPFLAEHVESFQGFWRQYQVWSGPGGNGLGEILGQSRCSRTNRPTAAHIAAKVAGSMTITAGTGDDLLYVNIIQTQQGTEWLGPGKE